MKKLLGYLTILVLLLSSAPLVQAQSGSVGAADKYSVYNASIMRMDPITREKGYQAYLNAPKSYIDPVIQTQLTRKASKPVPLLLDHVVYTPSERNQSSCGNCWVWAGTALIETKHSVETGVKDRLSIQWFDSKYYDVHSYSACGGGWLTDLVGFYNSYTYIPWSNTNAQFQDQAGGNPHIASSSITTIPYYYGNTNALVAATVPTNSVTQATAIANIKNVLNQRKAVQFSFWLANSADWKTFFDFWDLQTETAIWDPDSVCGHTEGTGSGGHSVTIVGYDDTDASTANHYWIVLNSWGTGATGNRPNGLFRMKMYMNYACKVNTASSWYYSRLFENVETASGKVPFVNTNRLFMASKGASTNTLWTRNKATGGSWSTWAMMDGASSESPAMASFNTRLYMVRKEAANTTLRIRWSKSTTPWTTWTTLSGSTDAAPALVTYRNKLYLFVKTAGGGAVQYKSMSTGGTWTTWATVPGSNTPYAPAVVAHNDKLILLQTGTDGVVYMNSMNSAGTWLGWGGLGWNLITNRGPAAAVFDNRVHVAVKGVVGTPNSTKISIAASAGDVGGGWYTWSEIPGAGATTEAPQMATGPDLKTLNVTVKGTNTTLWSQTYNLTTYAWNSAWASMPGYSNRAPSLNTYWFSLANPYPTTPHPTDLTAH